MPTVTTPDEERQHFFQIEKKLMEVQGISCIKLAKESFNCKKDDLGMLFLEKEKSIQTKIPQYIELQKWDKAIELTLETHDSNLMEVVLDKMLKAMDLEGFLSNVAFHRNAYSAIIDFLNKKHPEIIEAFLKNNSLHEELFFYNLENYFSSNVLKDRTYHLSQAKIYLQDLVRVNKEKWAFYTTYLQDLENSMVFKSDCLYESFIKADTSDFDRPLFTFFNEVITGEKISYLESKNKQYFNFDPRRINSIRMKAYAENRQIDAMKILGANLNPKNANYMAFTEICYDNKLFNEAVTFLKKINPEEYFDYKFNLLKSMEKYYEALEFVIADKNCDEKEQFINDILNKDPSLEPRVRELCMKYKVQL